MAYRLLEEARDEGNPDAYYFLARCHAGTGFVRPAFGFEEDENRVAEYLDLAIGHGSALAMLSARRFGGYTPKGGSYVHAPYTSEREVWNVVCAQAEFARYPGEALAIIGMGEMYAYGLGVPQDIKRGMEYWAKLPKDERVQEHKRNFKKTLFGWKQR
ncbi:MAG: sel1 repeat family protein [Lachnospiraceae bacterium]|nr:sel1 repeat family protein [Lachnospiraceae bacterium]